MLRLIKDHLKNAGIPPQVYESQASSMAKLLQKLPGTVREKTRPAAERDVQDAL